MSAVDGVEVEILSRDFEFGWWCCRKGQRAMVRVTPDFVFVPLPRLARREYGLCRWCWWEEAGRWAMGDGATNIERRSR